MRPTSSALGALASHRFLQRAALAATSVFAWVFALEFFYAATGDLSDAFVRVILLYTLAQVVTALLTPYSARQLVHGIKKRMIAGVCACILGLITLAAGLAGLYPGIFGLIAFAIFIGMYRAIYWIPYSVEMNAVNTSGTVPQEFFIALMPAIAGFALITGPLGAAALLFAGATVLIASLAPLSVAPEGYERFAWGYSETFAELFEPKYNALLETAFLSGIQGAALLLLWPLAVFIIVGLSYKILGLVIAATLLSAILLRHRGQKYLEKKELLAVTIAASSWLARLVVASPLAVIVVDAYSSTGKSPGDLHTMEQFADNGTYIDELTALKEIGLAIGRIFMCIFAAVAISALSLPAGLGLAFVLAAAASGVAVIHSRRRVEQF